MIDLPLTFPAVACLVAMQVVLLADLWLFSRLSQRGMWQAILPLDASLSMPAEPPPASAGDRGATEHAVWRRDPDRPELIYFRRAFQLGRRPYSMGVVHWTGEGPTVRWAPWPFASWLVIVAGSSGFLALLGPESGLPPTALVGVVPLFAVAALVNMWLSSRDLRNRVVPELASAWLDAVRAG